MSKKLFFIVFAAVLFVIMSLMFACGGDDDGDSDDGSDGNGEKTGEEEEVSDMEKACTEIIACSGEFNWWAAGQEDECAAEMQQMSDDGKDCQVECLAAIEECAQISQCLDEDSDAYAEYCSEEGGEDTGVELGGSEELKDCAAESCQDKLDACKQGCQDYLACIDACRSDDAECQLECGNDYPAGKSDANKLHDCLMEFCYEEMQD